MGGRGGERSETYKSYINMWKYYYMKRKIVWVIGGCVIFFGSVCAVWIFRGFPARIVEDTGILVDKEENGGVIKQGSDKAQCVISGCSGQLCVKKDDVKKNEDISTTCEWREEYGCYKEGQCEVQSDGQCGWTMTEGLTTCLEKIKGDSNWSQALSEEEAIPVETKKSGSNEKSMDFSPTLSVEKRWVSWGFSVDENRKVDAIILHSSYNSLGGDKYDIDSIVDIYRQYGVSAHYIIGRDGKIRQLVSEKDVAYHAGVSALPDGRTEVNAVSIGIEMVNDDKGDRYTDKQYGAVNNLIADIKARHSIQYVLGHNDIATGRKTDPWNFDWERVKK